MMHATKVADANAKKQEQTYFWISNQKALFLRHIPDTRFYEALEVDRDTGLETNLKAFNGRYRSFMVSTLMYGRVEDGKGNLLEPIDIVYLPPSCVLSPDGKWLLWRNLENDRLTWIAATVDGAGERRWISSGITSSLLSCWMPDGSRWVELHEHNNGSRTRFTGAVLRSVEDTNIEQKVRLANAKEGRVLGATEDSTLLIAYYPYGERSAQVDISACGLHSGIAVTWDYKIQLPRPLAVYEIELSSQGSQLAWLLGDMDDRLESGKTIELWVSDLKGQGMQMVEEVPVVEKKTSVWSTHFDLPDELRWLPDGKNLSYLYQKALWTVSIV